jgi:hypothetical protein
MGKMSDAERHKSLDESVEAALLDADLFVKYKAPHRAIGRLHEAIAHYPRSIVLREKLREVAVISQQPAEGARQCLALVTLYISRENFEAAHERLLEAKHIDPRINIAPGLEAIRRARRPDLPQVNAATARPEMRRTEIILAGDLSTVSLFDAVQVIENSRLTGGLILESGERKGRVLFNEGRIVGAEFVDKQELEAFRLIVELTNGTFDFHRASEEFPITINAQSNTTLILEALRRQDEEAREEEAD